MKKLIYILPFFAFLACTKEVKIPIPGYEEQVVIDGTIEIDGPPFVLLSTTKDIYSPTDLQAYLNSFISGATVTVSDGENTVVLDEVCSDEVPPGFEPFVADLFGVPADQLGEVRICAYTTFDASIFGQQGKTYNLTVEYAGETYTSSTTLEAPIPFDSVYWKPEKTTPSTEGQYGFSWVTLSDPADKYNAYFWEVKRINLDSAGNERDGLFTPTFNPVFDDEFFSGTTFDFAYENPMSFEDVDIPDIARGYYEVGDTVVIKFSSLDRDVYEYFEKKYIQINNGGSPFAVPANIPSNIEGGALGVWAGFAPHFDTLICKP